ncbi:hypothetical protein [Sinomicrobium weinanense]|uniref:Uncharacterized protein n=1 Tax=Sinomicrobium weinanense TaxID=2842200 RepID=A0A926JT54_9FLAO|nr:hypothetical protein [Sinomicrobium weinanense]MBC9797023.1 hypothetical protein [Sinomicrobium weinanense]MBU3123279.1 hypothetical protein [Sinomicrobium weinanense]
MSKNKTQWTLFLIGLAITIIGLVTRKFLFIFLLLPLGFLFNKKEDKDRKP